MPCARRIKYVVYRRKPELFARRQLLGERIELTRMGRTMALLEAVKPCAQAALRPQPLRETRKKGPRAQKRLKARRIPGGWAIYL